MGRYALKDHAERSQSKKMSFKSQDFLSPALSLDVSAFSGTDLFDEGMCTLWGGRFVIPQGSKSVKAPMSGCQATEPSSFPSLLNLVRQTVYPRHKSSSKKDGASLGKTRHSKNKGKCKTGLSHVAKVTFHISDQSASHLGLVIWRTGWTARTQQSLPGFPKPTCSSCRVKQGTQGMSWLWLMMLCCLF